jgi:hypothetical protein
MAGWKESANSGWLITRHNFWSGIDGSPYSQFVGREARTPVSEHLGVYISNPYHRRESYECSSYAVGSDTLMASAPAAVSAVDY